MNLSDEIVRNIRTYVPLAVGALISTVPWLTDFVRINGQALTLLVVAAYYGLACLAEQRWPALGWFLGSPK